MKYDPNIHHRRSIRLKGYDYSQAGAYFVTICVQNRDFLFGEVVEEEMELNDAGQMVMKWWEELNNKFNYNETDEAIVMPNHFHGIMIIEDQSPVGAALHGRPEIDNPEYASQNIYRYQLCSSKKWWRR